PAITTCSRSTTTTTPTSTRARGTRAASTWSSANSSAPRARRASCGAGCRSRCDAGCASTAGSTARSCTSPCSPRTARSCTRCAPCSTTSTGATTSARKRPSTSASRRSWVAAPSGSWCRSPRSTAATSCTGRRPGCSSTCHRRWAPRASPISTRRSRSTAPCSPTTRTSRCRAGLVTALEPHTSEVVQAGERRSARIESLRAVAALAVLVSHVWLYSHGFAASSYDSFVHRVIAGGGFGVQLFFALSGFLIFRPFARRDFGEGASIDWRTYVRNRAVRILPLYWCAVVVLLVFTQNGGSLTQWWRFTFFAQSFSAKTAQTVDGPMWSLVVELHFYILLPFLAWALAKVCRGRRWSAIAVLVVLAVPSVVFRRFDPEPFSIWRYSLPGTFYGFVPGMV